MGSPNCNTDNVKRSPARGRASGAVHSQAEPGNERVAEPEFVPSGFFALRTPLLPFDELLEWSAGLSAVQSGEDTRALEAACAADKLLLRQRLREAVGRPEFREALYVASPDLDKRLHAWERDPESEARQKIER